MTVSAFDHPFLSGLVGDEELTNLLGCDSEMAAMVAFESALAQAEAEQGIIPADAAATIGNALAGFKPDMMVLRHGTARDGVVVPELVRQMREVIGEPHAQHLHFGATSQDVIDTGLNLRLKSILPALDGQIAAIVERLDGLAARFGNRALMGRTRMQPAIAITVGDRISSWREPLIRHRARLADIQVVLLVVQFGGAAGTLDKLGDKAAPVRRSLAGRLALGDAPQWHSQRDRIADLANFLSLVSGSLGKLGQDVALLAQAGEEIVLKGGGGSSAVPGKQNPVGAEVLVSLARFNAVQLSGIHQGLVHEQERSGSSWTLEWLILPQMIMAVGAATRIAAELTANIEGLGT